MLDARGWSQPARTIPPGVDVDRFRPDRGQRAQIRRRLGWADAVPVVGFLGRFVAEKGLSFLMHALDRLEAPWHALFVGSGPMEQELRVWGRRYGDRVRVQAGVSHDDVPEYLNGMDVLCAPSQTTARWREQFGRMLIEAFSCGVPVIASTSGEIPHVVADAGITVDEGDCDGWVRAIRVVLADADRRADLSHRGRARALSTYAWPVVARQHLDFFNELTERTELTEETV